MTRIFGFESKTGALLEKSMLNQEIAKVFKNMQSSLRSMYAYGWHSFGAGFTMATDKGAQPLSLYKGYLGLTPNHDIWKELPDKTRQLLISGNIKALFGVLESEADRGEEDEIEEMMTLKKLSIKVSNRIEPIPLRESYLESKYDTFIGEIKRYGKVLYSS